MYRDDKLEKELLEIAEKIEHRHWILDNKLWLGFILLGIIASILNFYVVYFYKIIPYNTFFCISIFVTVYCLIITPGIACFYLEDKQINTLVARTVLTSPLIFFGSLVLLFFALIVFLIHIIKVALR